MRYLEEKLTTHGDRGIATMNIIRAHYDRVKQFQESIARGDFPNLYDLTPEQDIENLYQQRLTGFDTIDVVRDVVKHLAPEHKAVIEKLGETGAVIQKLNDADDIGTHRGHAKANAGADFRKGEITALTKKFSQFPQEDQIYIREQLPHDLQNSDTTRIDEILLRNGVYQECVKDLRRLSSKAISTMAELKQDKTISPLEFAFLFKKLNVFVDNSIIANMEDKVRNYEQQREKPAPRIR